MLALISYVLALALVGLVGAQNTSTTAFNPGTVSLATRLSWCRAEINSCPEICGGGDQDNSCDENTLDFSCVCSNGTTANVALYMNTIPFFICHETYAQCVAAHPNDLQGQQTCTDAAKCGTLNATSQAASSSSSSAAATSAASSTSTSPSATGSGSSTTSASAKASGMATKLGQDYGMGLMATMFAIAFKFLL